MKHLVIKNNQMGISGWYTVFGDSAITHGCLKGKILGIDVSYDIYRASLGMRKIAGLTDKKGTPTLLLNTLLCNIIKYKKMGVRGLIYIFDNPLPTLIKHRETAKRRRDREKAALQTSADLTEEKKDSLEKKKFTITPEMVADVKTLLTLIGVAWIVAPEGYEAEHLGAELTIDGVIDTLMTADSDSLLFGAKSMTRCMKKKGSNKKIYQEFTLDNVLTDYDITRECLVHMGVVLGCDFAEKTRGIGVKTVLEKGPLVDLTDEQTIAKKYFLSKCPWRADMINTSTIDEPELVKWLVGDKNFGKDRVLNMMKVYATLDDA